MGVGYIRTRGGGLPELFLGKNIVSKSCYKKIIPLFNMCSLRSRLIIILAPVKE